MAAKTLNFANPNCSDDSAELWSRF